VGIYWGNHHHLLHTASGVNGKIMWANTHLLFWLSLVPFTTAWINEKSFDSISVAIYGTDLILCAIAYQILARQIKSGYTRHTKLTEALHRSGPKEWISTISYVASIPLAFVHPMISCAIYVILAIIWIVPNKEIEQVLEETV
jgi:uncharacterized membrane protein